MKKFRGRQLFNKYKTILRLFYTICKIIPLKVRIKILNSCRNLNGKLGIAIRYILIKTISKKCGDNVSIFSCVYICNPQNISFGDNISIHPMCYIECGDDSKRGVIIESNVSIAHGVTIMGSTHTFTKSDVNIKDQPIECKQVIIKENVWIGAKATILAGITIESGCIIAAGSVITKSTLKNGIYAGVPAKRIKDRQ